MKNFDPDVLLEATSRSTMGTALLLSLAIHACVVFGTSFGLYREWKAYGLHSPSTIKQIKKEQAEQVREVARRQEAEKRAAVAEEDAGKTQKPSASPADPNAEKPPVAPELEPLPPKSEFQLGEDFDI